MASFPLHVAVRIGREDAAIDQSQRRVELLSEIFRASAVIGESGDGRQGVLIAALAAKGRLHPPDGDQRPRRYAVALLDGCEQGRLGLLKCAPARDDGGDRKSVV